MSRETAPKPESLNAQFVSQIDETHRELARHAIWNVGMPFETPLRWNLEQHQGEESPRSLSLWINLGDDAFIYLDKKLDPSKSNNKAWSIVAKEPSEEEGVDSIVTRVSVSTGGEITSSQARYKGKSGNEVYVVSADETSRSDESNSKLYVSDLLRQALEVMPARQQEFMDHMSLDELKKAEMFQRLSTQESKQELPIP